MKNPAIIFLFYLDMENYEKDYEGFNKSRGRDKDEGNGGMLKGLLIGAVVASLLFYFMRSDSQKSPEPIVIRDTVYIEKEVEAEEAEEEFENIEVAEIEATAVNAVPVEQPALNISIPNNNIFYIACPNKVEISASGMDPFKISVAISNGSITRGTKPEEYVVNVKTPGKVKINASYNLDGRVNYLGSKEFVVKRVPNPVPCIGKDEQTKHGGEIKKNVLMAQAGVLAEFPDFDFDMKFTVVSFKVAGTIKGFTQIEEANSAAFTPKQKALINNMAAGSILSIYDIKAKGPDGTIRDLQSIVYKIK